MLDRKSVCRLVIHRVTSDLYTDVRGERKLPVQRKVFLLPEDEQKSCSWSDESDLTQVFTLIQIKPSLLKKQKHRSHLQLTHISLQSGGQRSHCSKSPPQLRAGSLSQIKVKE